jgi:hypothetical protein
MASSGRDWCVYVYAFLVTPRSISKPDSINMSIARTASPRRWRSVPWRSAFPSRPAGGD